MSGTYKSRKIKFTQIRICFAASVILSTLELQHAFYSATFSVHTNHIEGRV